MRERHVGPCAPRPATGQQPITLAAGATSGSSRGTKALSTHELAIAEGVVAAVTERLPDSKIVCVRL
jgi:hypothetical protein